MAVRTQLPERILQLGLVSVRPASAARAEANAAAAIGCALLPISDLIRPLHLNRVPASPIVDRTREEALSAPYRRHPHTPACYLPESPTSVRCAPTAAHRYLIFAITCPFHGNAQWRAIRDGDPDGWADVVAFDAAIRHGHLRATASHQELRGTYYLHHSRQPLAQADLDATRSHRRPRAAAVSDLAESGDPDGCSPWACRSGLPVTGTGEDHDDLRRAAWPLALAGAVRQTPRPVAAFPGGSRECGGAQCELKDAA